MDAIEGFGLESGLSVVELVGHAGRDSASSRTNDCARPVRLRGSTQLVDVDSGETRVLYSSAQELDGFAWVPCGNRRASGPVHGIRQRGPCRARRDKPVCSHGRPLWCNRRHRKGDPQLGDPLCGDCYDYTAHVVWQWHAPELWRRTTIALQRDLARRCGITVGQFKDRCTIAYAKVAEFQARGVIHLHVPIRLDGPGGPDGDPPDLPLTTTDLEDAIRDTAARVRLLSAPLADGRVYRLRWGEQVDCRTINETADRDSRQQVPVVHPEQVGSYLAKYLTKATEAFGLPATVRSAGHARLAGATDHTVRIIDTAQEIAGHGEAYSLLLSHLGTLGYRGHPITKSRAYSVTFGQLRRARRYWRRNPTDLAQDVDIRELHDDDTDIPDGFQLISSWMFLGQGYLDLDQAAAAVRSATASRTRRSRRTATTTTTTREAAR